MKTSFSLWALTKPDSFTPVSITKSHLLSNGKTRMLYSVLDLVLKFPSIPCGSTLWDCSLLFQSVCQALLNHREDWHVKKKWGNFTFHPTFVPINICQGAVNNTPLAILQQRHPTNHKTKCSCPFFKKPLVRCTNIVAFQTLNHKQTMSFSS